MKKLLLLATVLIGLTAGCKKTTANLKIEPTIVGKWHATQTIKTDYSVTPKQLTIKNLPNQDDNYVFKTDGTGQFITGTASITTKYQISGSVITITWDPPSNQVYKYEIAELTADKLILLEITKKDNVGKTTETFETWYTKAQ